MKLAVFVMSDPANGKEALGRVFNALAVAVEANSKGDEVNVVFAGTGTHWPAQLSKLGHPAHALYDAARPVITGASCACATVFEAKEGITACGIPEINNNPIPGTPGLASFRKYVADGWQTLVF